MVFIIISEAQQKLLSEKEAQNSTIPPEDDTKPKISESLTFKLLPERNQDKAHLLKCQRNPLVQLKLKPEDGILRLIQTLQNSWITAEDRLVRCEWFCKRRRFIHLSSHLFSPCAQCTVIGVIKHRRIWAGRGCSARGGLEPLKFWCELKSGLIGNQNLRSDLTQCQGGCAKCQETELQSVMYSNWCSSGGWSDCGWQGRGGQPTVLWGGSFPVVTALLADTDSFIRFFSYTVEYFYSCMRSLIHSHIQSFIRLFIQLVSWFTQS